MPSGDIPGPEPKGDLYSSIIIMKSPRSTTQGAALLMLVITLILLGISLSVALPRATNDVRRYKEDELRFILGEYRRAVRKFRDRNRREPKSLGELLKDQKQQCFLRRIYPDPFTGKTDWVFTHEKGETIIRSESEEPSLAGVPYKNFR